MVDFEKAERAFRIFTEVNHPSHPTYASRGVQKVLSDSGVLDENARLREALEKQDSLAKAQQDSLVIARLREALEKIACDCPVERRATCGEVDIFGQVYECEFGIARTALEGK